MQATLSLAGTQEMASNPTKPKPIRPDRSKISLDGELVYWTKHLGVSKEDLIRAVNKVGNAAAAVRKELGLSLR